MTFKLQPILAHIKTLYQKPISVDRFQEYLGMLQGNTKGDLALPISGFNPMAKDHILQKIEELELLDAEAIVEEAIVEVNRNLPSSVVGSAKEIIVVINIADDLKGSWTNYYTTDFDSKFKLNAFVNRGFCVPYFWTSESYSKQLIHNRTTEYMARTHYRFNNPQPITLEDHFLQEVFVAKMINDKDLKVDHDDLADIETFYPVSYTHLTLPTICSV